MPNGGSDCCGTCCFNRANHGQAGYPDKTARAEAFCQIRELAIATPFWTYCANHPHHNPEQIDTPVGPVLVCDSYPYTRRVWVPCPDTQEIRTELLGLLETIREVPHYEYPTETKFDESVIDQLAVFRERRAIAGLRRVIRFDPKAAHPDDRFGRTRAATIGHAVEALAAIVGDDALDEIEHCLDCGLAEARAGDVYEPQNDATAAVRYHAVRALDQCRSSRSAETLSRALEDPHPEIRAFAVEMLARRE